MSHKHGSISRPCSAPWTKSRSSTTHTCTCLKDFIDKESLPVAVTVITGNYSMYNGIRVQASNVLYLYRKFKRIVARCSLQSGEIVNVPLKQNVKIGFKTEAQNLSTSHIVKCENLPPLLYVIKGCSKCDTQHMHVQQSEVLVVLNLKFNVLEVLNPYTMTYYSLPLECDAQFSTNPKLACIDFQYIVHLLLHPFPWNILFSGGLLSCGLKSLEESMIGDVKVETELCIEIQIIGIPGRYLMPVSTPIEVTKSDLQLNNLTEHDYEELDVLNQPTVIQKRRKASWIGIPTSRKSSASNLSTVSSISSCFNDSSASSFTSVTETPSLPHIAEVLHSDKTFILPSPTDLNLKNILNGTQKIATKIFLLGINLGIPYHVIEICEADHPFSLMRKNAAIMNYWLENFENKSWSNIVTALKDMNEDVIADSIEKKYCADHTVSTDTCTSFENKMKDEPVEPGDEQNKKEFKKSSKELVQMREDLRKIEFICLSQTDKKTQREQCFHLEDMKYQVELKGISVQQCKAICEHSQITERQQHLHVSAYMECSDTNYSSTTYYNAVSASDSDQKGYVSKLWVSEKEIIDVELQEVIARRQTLENGLEKCKRKLAELKWVSSVHVASIDRESLLNNCYYVRLMLHKTSYQCRFAKLCILENELKQKLEYAEIKEKSFQATKQDNKLDPKPFSGTKSSMRPYSAKPTNTTLSQKPDSKATLLKNRPRSSLPTKLDTSMHQQPLTAKETTLPTIPASSGYRSVPIHIRTNMTSKYTRQSGK